MKLGHRVYVMKMHVSKCEGINKYLPTAIKLRPQKENDPAIIDNKIKYHKQTTKWKTNKLSMQKNDTEDKYISKHWSDPLDP